MVSGAWSGPYCIGATSTGIHSSTFLEPKRQYWGLVVEGHVVAVQASRYCFEKWVQDAQVPDMVTGSAAA